MEELERVAKLAIEYIRQREKAELRQVLREIIAGKVRSEKEHMQYRSLTPFLLREGEESKTKIDVIPPAGN